jgi:quercetin dioxygenase-like cupin family protein
MRMLVVIALPLLLAASPAPAKDLKWGDAPAALPKGAQMAVVSGDPGKAGRFVVQLRMPADYKVPPHHHPSAEVVKVLSGTLHYAMSDKLDMASAKTLRAGHTVTMKAKMNHWVHAPGPASVQISGTGPFQITYVDPKDDPRH